MRVTLGHLRWLLREAYEEESYRRQLYAIIERHAGPNVYLRFDDREPFSKSRSFRLDMNPNDHTNHAGLWTYMLEGGDAFLGEATFGSSGQWVTILKAKDPNRIVRSDRYTETDLERDLNRLAHRVPRGVLSAAIDRLEHRKAGYLRDYEAMDPDEVGEDVLRDIMDDLRKPATPFEKLDSIAGRFGRGKDHRDNMRQFYLELGYAGIDDPEGVIDTNGWTAVHFDPRNVHVVRRYRLKDAFDPVQYDKEEDEWRRSRMPRLGRNPPDDIDPDNPGNWRDNDGDVDPPYEKGFYYDRSGVRKPDPRGEE